jgi:hypothetical protein
VKSEPIVRHVRRAGTGSVKLPTPTGSWSNHYPIWYLPRPVLPRASLNFVTMRSPTSILWQTAPHNGTQLQSQEDISQSTCKAWGLWPATTRLKRERCICHFQSKTMRPSLLSLPLLFPTRHKKCCSLGPAKL